MEDQNRRNLMKSFGTLMAGLSMGTTASAAQSNNTISPSVSKEEALETAQIAVRALSRQREYFFWGPEALDDPSLFYAKVDSSGTTRYVPRAWVFPLSSWNTELGYITIDAEQTSKPVLAYGKSSAPQRSLSDASRIAQESNTSLMSADQSDSDRARFLYHGGVEYSIETTSGLEISLRGGYTSEAEPVRNAEALQPNKRVASDGGIVTISGGDAPDWSGGTDDEIYGVPDWTEDYIEGQSSNTQIGIGPDSWDEWDGCVPIAGANVLGYHENIPHRNQSWAESTIDRLHMHCNTSDEGNTDPRDVANLDNWSQGNYDYNAFTKWTNMRGNAINAVSNNNPPILGMVRGPYSKDGWKNGHAVVVVGYEIRSNDFWPGNSIYYKVHNGRDEPGPDEVAGGNWANAQLTKVQKQ